jgi:hypothetical protein
MKKNVVISVAVDLIKHANKGNEISENDLLP